LEIISGVAAPVMRQSLAHNFSRNENENTIFDYPHFVILFHECPV